VGGSASTAIIAAVAIIVLVLDQATKALIVAAIGPAQSASAINLVGGWMSLEYVENRGAAFGLFFGVGPLLPVVAVAVLLVLAWRVLRSPQQPLLNVVAFGLILGGALGNLVDRFRFGFVVDFVSVGWWPNFNLADSAICLGVVLMLLGWLSPGLQKLSFQARR
jgi:signal peptidase II